MEAAGRRAALGDAARRAPARARRGAGRVLAEAFCEGEEEVESSLRAKRSNPFLSLFKYGLLRRGACHRAGPSGPDPLAPRNDEQSHPGGAICVRVMKALPNR